MFSGADQENKKKKWLPKEHKNKAILRVMFASLVTSICLQWMFFGKKNIHFASLTPYLPKYDGGNRYQRNDFPSADEGKA